MLGPKRKQTLLINSEAGGNVASQMQNSGMKRHVGKQIWREMLAISVFFGKEALRRAGYW